MSIRSLQLLSQSSKYVVLPSNLSVCKNILPRSSWGTISGWKHILCGTGILLEDEYTNLPFHITGICHVPYSIACYSYGL